MNRSKSLKLLKELKSIRDYKSFIQRTNAELKKHFKRCFDETTSSAYDFQKEIMLMQAKGLEGADVILNGEKIGVIGKVIGFEVKDEDGLSEHYPIQHFNQSFEGKIELRFKVEDFTPEELNRMMPDDAQEEKERISSNWNSGQGFI